MYRTPLLSCLLTALPLAAAAETLLPTVKVQADAEAPKRQEADSQVLSYGKDELRRHKGMSLGRP